MLSELTACTLRAVSWSGVETMAMFDPGLMRRMKSSLSTLFWQASTMALAISWLFTFLRGRPWCGRITIFRSSRGKGGSRRLLGRPRCALCLASAPCDASPSCDCLRSFACFRFSRKDRTLSHPASIAASPVGTASRVLSLSLSTVPSS